MAYKRKDHFYLKAKRERKISRAVYKLSELLRRFKLVEREDIVLDLGAAPGGWLQELSPAVGPKGRVIGIDLLPLKISPPPNCKFILGDLTEEENQNMIVELANGKVDCVFSDMSPNLSGITFADAYRSYEVAMLAFEMCEKLLKPDGNFVVKIFPGHEFHDFVKDMKQNFKKVNAVVPEATRKSSSERYVVALGYKKQ